MNGAGTVNASAIGAGGGGGGASSAGGIGGRGGGATASANAKTSSLSGNATAYALASGGQGGAGIGAGGFAGAGGIGRATADAMAAGTGTAMATAVLVGGAGGTGSRAAAGVSARLSNAARGATNGGTLILAQRVVGGAASNSTDNARGGYSDSSLVFDDRSNSTQSAKLVGTSTATGGAGSGLNSRGGGASATISLIGTGNVSATAAAYGGASGFGGSGGGTASSHATAQTTGAGAATATAMQVGGAGGNNYFGTAGKGADASVTADVSGATDGGTLTLSQTAAGGAGGNSDDGTGGVGGDAFSDLPFDDLDSLTHSASVKGASTATGGAGGSGYTGGAGGQAVASAVATGAHSISAIANANGGAGGNGQTGYQPTGGAGGTASATAAASTTSATGDATASATATGGAGGAGSGFYGGTGGAGGSGTAGATATTAGTGTATAAAYLSGGNGGYGADDPANGVAATLVNAVKGSTVGGTLVLRQDATGGNAGQPGPYSPGFASGGSAASSLTFDDLSNPTQSAALHGYSSAQGGVGAGAANASIDLTGRTGVSARASASGGAGNAGVTGDGTNGATGRLGTVRGTSTHGGAVAVTGIVTGGAGGAGGSSGSGGNGANASVTNAIGGSTTGTLRLIQTAIGGAGGNTEGKGNGGAAGTAASSLTYETADAAPLYVTANGVGGAGGGAAYGIGSYGGDVTASATAVNAIGNATATANATGGAGGYSGKQGSSLIRPAARRAVRRLCWGSGGAGLRRRAPPRPAAAGGYGYNSSCPGGNGAGVRLNDAVGGYTAGGTLRLQETATGGAGGYGKSGGAGGNSSARLSFDDTSSKQQSAALYGAVAATGGNGSGAGDGGSVSSYVDLIGAGSVTATAVATDGAGGPTAGAATAQANAYTTAALGGAATATSTAAGYGTQPAIAGAVARYGGAGSVVAVNAEAGGEADGNGVVVESGADVGTVTSLPDSETTNGFALATGLPTTGPFAGALGAIEVGDNPAVSTSGEQTYELHATLDIDTLAMPISGDILVGLVSDSGGADFDTLDLTLQQELLGTTLAISVTVDVTTNAADGGLAISATLATGPAGGPSAGPRFHQSFTDPADFAGFLAQTPTIDLGSLDANPVGLAQAKIDAPSSINLGDFRVGGTASQTLRITNNAAGPADSLDAAVTGLTGDATASGAINALGPGSTDTSSISVGVDTSAAGARSGSVTLGFTSDPGGIALPSQTVDVAAGVYREATAAIDTPLPQAYVHVGDPSPTLAITNTAASDGYSENLIASVAGSSGLAASGSTGDIAPQATSNAVDLGISTATAGETAGAVTLAYQSDGTGIDGFGPTSIVEQTVNVDVHVNNYAAASIEQSFGSAVLTGSGTSYTLDFGTVIEGSGLVPAGLLVLNNVLGPADTLSGAFTDFSGDTAAFQNSDFGTISALAAGDADFQPEISFSTAQSGQFTETVTLDPVDSNPDYSAPLSPITLTVEGTVVAPVAWAKDVNGDWTTAADWAPRTVPGIYDDVTIAAAGANAYTVTSAANVTVDSIATGATATLNLNGGTFTTLTGTGSGINAGTIKIQGTSAFEIEGSFSDAATGVISAARSGAVIDLADADVSGGAISIVAGATAQATGSSSVADATVTDKGTLEAANGGTLALIDATVDAAGGGVVESLDAVAGSPSIVLLDNATINRGTLTTIADGVIETAAGTNDTLIGSAISADSTLTVVDGSTLTVAGNVGNAGTLALGSTGDPTDVVATAAAARLANTGEISGAGEVGDGDADLTLVNNGTIEATGSVALVIDTGRDVSNTGVFKATGSGRLVVDDNVSGAGQAEIATASTMEFKGSTTSAVTFENNAGNTGALILDPSAAFKGTVAGLLSDGTNSDTLDLEGINFASGVTWSFDQTTSGEGSLTVKDHGNDAIKVTLLGQYLATVGQTVTSAHSCNLFSTAADTLQNTSGTLITTSHA